eukprot:264967_1
MTSTSPEKQYQVLAAPPEEVTAVYLNSSISSIQNEPISEKKEEPPLKLSNHWTRFVQTEMYGTFIATFVVDFVLYTLSGESYEDLIESGFLYLAAGIAFGYFFGIIICWDANLNAAFTFALALCNVKPWKFVPMIMISQLIGAVLAHLSFYYIIGSPDTLDAALAFCFGISPPLDDITNGRILFSSVIVMTILVLGLFPVFAPELGGDANMSHSAASLMVFVIIAGVTCFAVPTGAQTNPTTFFAGYIVMWILGFDHEYFIMHDHFWWTALVGPFLGVIVALCVLVNIAVITWNEPKNWYTAWMKMMNPPPQQH